MSVLAAAGVGAFGSALVAGHGQATKGLGGGSVEDVGGLYPLKASYGTSAARVDATKHWAWYVATWYVATIRGPWRRSHCGAAWLGSQRGSMAGKPLKHGMAGKPLRGGMAGKPLKHCMAGKPLRGGMAGKPLRSGLARRLLRWLSGEGIEAQDICMS